MTISKIAAALFGLVILAGLGFAPQASATPGNGLGPPAGAFYAFDQTYATVVTPTSLPNHGPFDILYMFPDCPTCTPVSDAAPGHPGYNGGRWKVVQAFGVTTQLTNAAAVQSAATSLVYTGVRFVCPLIPN